MVSASIAGTVNIYIVSPSGKKYLQASKRSYWFSPGGASEAVPANTPEKWNTLPVCPDQGGPGSAIQVCLIADAAATTDASDGFMNLPVIVNGLPQTISNDLTTASPGNLNFGVDLAWQSIAVVAGVETPIMQYRAKEGVHYRIGGDRVNLSIENNA